jgi:MFS family permease
MDLRRFSYLVIFGLAFGGLLIAAANTLPLLFLAILVLRHLGQGLMGMAGGAAMVRYLPREKGKANAISGMGYSVAEAILPSAVVALLALMGWRESWIVWSALIALVLPVSVHRLLRGHDQRHRDYLDELQRPAATAGGAGPTPQRQWTRDEVIRDPLFYLFLPAILTTPMLFTGFMFHQVYLVDTKGWSLTVWGGLYTLYAVTSTVMKLLTGLLVDRFGAIRLVPIMVLPMGLGLLVLAGADDLAVAFAFMVLLGITVGGYATISSPFFAEKYGTLHLGAIKSVTTAAMVFSSAISPVLMGWLIDAGVGMDSQALGGVIWVLAAAGMAWTAQRRTLRQTG